MDEELLGTTPYGVTVRRGGQVLFLPSSLSPANAADALSAPISASPPEAPAPQQAPVDLSALTNPLAGLGVTPAGAPAAQPAPAARPDPFAGGAPEGVISPASVAPAAATAPPTSSALGDLANPLAGLGAPPAPSSTSVPRGVDPFAGGLPDGLARPPVDPLLPVPAGADAVSGVGPLAGSGAAGGAPQPKPTAAAPGGEDLGDEEPPQAPTTPYQDEQTALLAKGMLAKERAADEADVVARRNKAIADKDAVIAKAQKTIDDRINELVPQYDAAIQARADYNAKLAKMPDPGEMSSGKIFALILGGLGAALNRDPRGVQPIIDIINMRADREANRRVKQQERLDAAAAGRGAQLSGAYKQREGLTERLKIEKAAILEEYAREAESIGKHYEGENAFVESQRLAAGIRKEAVKDAYAAAKDQVDAEIRRENIAQDERASRRTAATAAANLALERQKWDAQLPMDERRLKVQEAQLALNERNAALEAEKAAIEKEAKIGERRVFGLPQVKIDPASGKPVADAAGNPVFERTILRNSDGSEFRPPTKEEAVLARKTTALSNRGIQLVDKILTIVETEGWSSDTVRSEAWLKAKSNLNELIAARKGEADLALGVLAGPDMTLLEGILGGDPTGIRDPSAALRTARANILLGANTALVGMGYDGPTFNVVEITPSARGKVKNSPAQQLLEDAQARGEAPGPGDGLNKSLLSEQDFKESFGIGNLRKQDPRAFPTRSASAAIAEIARMAANKNTPPEQREQYVSALKQLAEDPSPIVQNRVRTTAAKLKIDLGDEFNAPNVGAPRAPVSSDGVSKDLLKALDNVKERGAPGAAGIATGYKNLSPADRARAIAAIGTKGEDSRAEYFPSARAGIAIGKLIEASLAFDDPKTQQWAQYQLENIALTDPSPIVRRRVRRAAKERGIALRGADAAAGAASGGVTSAIGAN